MAVPARSRRVRGWPDRLVELSRQKPAAQCGTSQPTPLPLPARARLAGTPLPPPAAARSGVPGCRPGSSGPPPGVKGGGRSSRCMVEVRRHARNSCRPLAGKAQCQCAHCGDATAGACLKVRQRIHLPQRAERGVRQEHKAWALLQILGHRAQLLQGWDHAERQGIERHGACVASAAPGMAPTCNRVASTTPKPSTARARCPCPTFTPGSRTSGTAMPQWLASTSAALRCRS